VYMGEISNAHKTLVTKPETKISLGRSRHRLRIILKWILQK